MSGSSWPPPELNTPTVAHRDAILTSSASARINAPAARVFEVLLDVAEYGKWNSWCPEVTIQSQPASYEQSKKLHKGTRFTFHVVMDAAKPDSKTPTQLRITDISTLHHPSDYIPKDTLERDGTYTADLGRVYRISWKIDGGFASRGLKAERFHEVISLGERECEVRTWENQGGVLARAVKWMYSKTLPEKFAIWCADLKKYCEQESSQDPIQRGIN